MYYNQNKLCVIEELLTEQIDDLCDFLKLRLKKSGYLLFGQCPVHQGDCPNAFKIYQGGENSICVWTCWTKHCEKVFKKTLIGLVRAVISQDKYNWALTKKIAPFSEAVNKACEFLGIKYKDIKIQKLDKEKIDFAKSTNNITKNVDRSNKYICKTEYFNNNLSPPQFFLDRGYNKDILNQYFIGQCNKPNKELYNRIVCPILNNSGEFVVSAVARSVYNICSKCNFYHKPQEICFEYPKWRHVRNTRPNSYLYNYWKAKNVIEKSGYIILVEGVGDVLKLVQAGISNVVGIFGNSLSDQQKIILEQNPIYDIIVLLDNDKSGKNGMDIIDNELKSLYRIHKMNWQGVNFKDVGEMNEDQIRNYIFPQFSGVIK